MITSSGFESSRYAIELTMAANESSSGKIFSRSFKSLDDEHTPGVFTVSSLCISTIPVGVSLNYFLSSLPSILIFVLSVS